MQRTERDFIEPSQEDIFECPHFDPKVFVNPQEPFFIENIKTKLLKHNQRDILYISKPATERKVIRARS